MTIPTVDENSRIRVPHDDEIHWDAHDRVPQRTTASNMPSRGWFLACALIIPVIILIGVLI